MYAYRNNGAQYIFGYLQRISALYLVQRAPWQHLPSRIV